MGTVSDFNPPGYLCLPWLALVNMGRCNMNLLLDWSVLCYNAWHRMASPNYEARTDIEIDEFSRNLSGMVLGYVERFKPDELIFALDGANYWRYRAYDNYYAENCEVYMEKVNLEPKVTIVEGRKQKVTQQEIIYYMIYDLKYYSFKYVPEMDKYIQKKLVKVEKEALDERLESDTGGITVADEIPDGIKSFIPTYKGNRKLTKWSYETPKKHFQEMSNKIAHSLAKILRAKVVKLEGAEADDIAYVYDKQYAAKTKIFITTDSDWHQLLRKGLFLKFYNPTTNEFVDKSAVQASNELAIKIMSGDSSDNIAAIALKDAKATLPAPNKKNKKLNKTELLVQEHGKDIYTYLEKEADPAMLKRNYQLVYLPNCPKKLQSRIHDVLEESEPVIEGALKLNTFGLKDDDILNIKLEAGEYRKLDIEAGHYDTN